MWLPLWLVLEFRVIQKRRTSIANPDDERLESKEIGASNLRGSDEGIKVKNKMVVSVKEKTPCHAKYCWYLSLFVMNPQLLLPMLLDGQHINLSALCSDPYALKSSLHYPARWIELTLTPMNLDLLLQCFCLDSSAGCA